MSNGLPNDSCVFAFPELTADEVETTSSTLVTGAPQPTALVGLLHAVGRDMERDSKGSLERLEGLVLAVHSWHPHPGIARHPGDRKGPAPILDAPKAAMEFTLFVTTRDVSAGEAPGFLSVMDRALEARRISGSQVWRRVGTGRVLKDAAAAKRLVSSLPFASVLCAPDNDLPPNGPGVDSMDALLRAVGFGRGGAARERGWVVPVSIGYRAIAAASEMRGLRGGATRHEWVEEIVGLAQWKPLRAAVEGGLRGCAWRARSGDVPPGLYVAEAI